MSYLTNDYTKKAHSAPEQREARPGEAVKWTDTPGEIILKLQRQGYNTNSLRVRALTYEEVTAMKGTDAEIWHLAANADNVQRAIDKHEADMKEIGAFKKERKEAEVTRFFRQYYNKYVDPSTMSGEDADFFKKIAATARKFGTTYPQLGDGSIPTGQKNFDALMRRIVVANLDPRDFSAWRDAFEYCGRNGSIILNESIVGGNSCVSGDALKNHPSLPDLLSPALSVREKRAKAKRDRIAEMSSDEYMASLPAEEQQAVRDSAMLDGGRYKNAQIAAQEQSSYDRAINSFTKLNPSYNRTSENQDKLIAWLSERSLPMTASNLGTAFKWLVGNKQMTTLETEVRYGGTMFRGEGSTITHGQSTAAEAISKQSLRAFVRNATSNQIAERCRLEPAFRLALDSIND
jgi:hypothetical protein